MKTFEIKIKTAPGQFQKMGLDKYLCLKDALVDVKIYEEVFKKDSIFVFSGKFIVCKTGNKTGSLREPFYKLNDGFHAVVSAANASGDAQLLKLAEGIGRAIMEMNDHLNSNYIWD